MKLFTTEEHLIDTLELYYEEHGEHPIKIYYHSPKNIVIKQVLKENGNEYTKVIYRKVERNGLYSKIKHKS